MTSADVFSFLKKHPVGVACGLLSVIFAALIYFRSSIIDEKQSEYDSKAAEAAKIISNVSLSKNLREQVDEIQVQTKDLESRLIRAGQLAINLQYFYKLEAETEVKLLDVRPNALPRNSATGYSGVPYNVTVQGPYKQVMVFLNRLEHGRHFCRFTNVVFGKASGGGDSSPQNIMTVTINLELLGVP